MARTYAGILGSLALATSLVDGLVHHREADGVLLAAWLSLWAFAGLGCVAGWVAARGVEESVGAAVAAELSERGSAGPSRAAEVPENR
ncbi:MAG TPA: hypothetical protein EYP56_12955 [Planctomycetaceae bacterium]|nr:hypothetical protein [Planctomycetaceae bacterium]HIQ22392.1 hypothetical protein [Planctomycetota bacterium]